MFNQDPLGLMARAAMRDRLEHAERARLRRAALQSRASGEDRHATVSAIVSWLRRVLRLLGGVVPRAGRASGREAPPESRTAAHG